MERQIYNPYLPLYEYTPDCEPHVFEGRVYVYGSHDQFGAFAFCHNNYVTYSAPLDDLTSWRYDGEILDKKEDPDSKNGKYDLYAPDCAKGPDGRYYLYYAYDWLGKIGVAVADKPSGPFHYYGHVHYKDGTELGRRKGDVFHFDPAIFVDEDKRVYLYSGFGAVTWFPQIKKGLKPDGGYAMELEADMLTIKSNPIKLFSKANDKENINGVKEKSHAFFEASSIRRFGDTYFFVYSSLAGHELCYMTSKSPLGPFTYRGVIISNGDVGYQGRTKKEACYPLGNNHGGIVKVKDEYYIFYHRHTNYTNTDRQDCAERITIDENGFIPQVEITSCGLNGKPLRGQGVYPSSICCCLIPKEGNIFYPFFALPHQKRKLRITQEKDDSKRVESQYIQNVQNGSLIGYKYFDLSKTHQVILTIKGKFTGKIHVLYQEKGKIEVTKEVKLKNQNEEKITIDISPRGSKEALYFSFEGKGRLSFYRFELL